VPNPNAQERVRELVLQAFQAHEQDAIDITAS
jgi:hypothetical protein